MAIQIPNPGTGNGATGDNEFVLWTKTKDNFSDQSNAASKLVGTSSGQVPTIVGNEGIGGFGVGGLNARIEYTSRQELQEANIPTGLYKCKTMLDGPFGESSTDWYILVSKTLSAYVSLLAISVNASSDNMYFCTYTPSGWTDWTEVYTNKNTDEHGTNGYLKPSSPILKVESGRMWGNSDGDRMGATYTKKGVGHYEISDTTGIRTDGWYIEIPNDLHGNPHVAVTIEDNKGNITLKCFKRVFNMDTFKFEPDLEQPLDIPDGRWIDLRFNEIPFEAQEELPTDGG